MERTAPKKVERHTKLALWLLISPSVLLVLTFTLFAVLNFSSTLLAPMVPDGEIMTQPAGLTVANIILYIFGVIGFISWLPGLITGIVLLTVKK